MTARLKTKKEKIAFIDILPYFSVHAKLLFKIQQELTLYITNAILISAPLFDQGLGQIPEPASNYILPENIITYSSSCMSK